MNKKILVTGGAGFIGSHLCERLVHEGYTVVAVDCLSDYYDPAIKKRNIRNLLHNKAFVFCKTDIRDDAGLRKIFSRYTIDKVVHLASEVGVRPSVERPVDYISTNVLGTQTLLELVRDFSVKQFIFGSSSSVYGKRSGNEGFGETDPLSPISPYAATKIAAEQLCSVYATTYNIPTTVLRFFTVYGPRNRPDMACFTFTDAIAQGKPINLFGKNVRRDFTFIDDVVSGIMCALKTPFSWEIINLGNSNPALISTLVENIEFTLEKKARITWSSLPPTDVPVTFATIDKAKKLLGWQPKIGLQQGVEELVRWYNSVYV